MWERLVVFVKYHNAVPLGFIVLFLSVSGALAANPEVREAAGEAVLSSEVLLKSVDNSFIVNTDLDAFTPTAQITDVREDVENYFIAYMLNTIDLVDGAWGTVSRQKELVVAKDAIRGKDLGLHVAKELGEVLGRQSEYLKEVQDKERTKGKTEKIVTTTYNGLIGKLLDPKEEIFPGYEPVIAERDSDGRAADAEGIYGGAATGAVEQSQESQRASVTSSEAKQSPSAVPGATEASTPTGATMKMTGSNPARVPTNATGGGYSDNGVIVQDEKQRDLSYTAEVDGARVVEGAVIDTRKPGAHSVRYKAVDRDGNVMALIRTVIVYDRYKMKEPALVVLGEAVVSIVSGSEYVDAGSIAIDYDDGDITAKITTTSTVDTATEGAYAVKYSITDSGGNTTTAARIVTVQSPPSL